jgi:SAM-dependent methyltransferase
MSNDLTNEDFWTEYWAKLQLPMSVNWNFKNDAVIAQSIIDAIPVTKNTTALEIGCAPGKWLSFLSQNLGCDITGIEYVPVAAKKTIENLKLLDIKNFNIITGDFFTYKPETPFDIVISLGFIEHFDNFEKVLEDQLKLVADGGYLIIGIPRFIGINYFLQKAIDKHIQNKLIPSHNLKTMNLEVFEKFSSNHNLKTVCNKYIGGYEPGLFPVAEVKNMPYRVFFKILLRVFNLLFGKFNSKYTSSYQIAILQK